MANEWIPAQAATGSGKDNSNIISSTSSDGLRPAWQQAKDFLDSNWLTSMASYVLPGIGTARMVDDAIGNFKEGNTWAGIGDAALAALSVVPGALGVLGVVPKGVKGLGGMMKAIKGGGEATEAGKAAAAGAKGIYREGSLFGRMAEKGTAEAGKYAEQADKVAAALKDTKNAAAEAEKASAAVRDSVQGAGSLPSFATRVLEEENALKTAKTAAQAAKDTEYTKALEAFFQRNSANPYVSNALRSAGGDFGKAYKSLLDPASVGLRGKDRAAADLFAKSHTKTGLKGTQWQRSGNKWKQYTPAPQQAGQAGATAAAPRGLVSGEEVLARMQQRQQWIDSLERLLKTPIERETVALGTPTLKGANISDDVARTLGLQKGATAEASVLDNYIAKTAHAGEMEKAYADAQAILEGLSNPSLGKIDAIANLLSGVSQGALRTAPWARGIIGSNLSPLLYQNGYYGGQE